MPPSSRQFRSSIDAAAQAALLDRELGLARLELRVVRLRQRESFRSAVGHRESRAALLVRWLDSAGGFGIAECSGRPDPYYNEEFLSGSLSLIRKFIVPLLDKRMTVRGLQQELGRIRGWNFTKAAVADSALDWLRRRGIHDLLDDWPAPRLERIPVGISLGIFPDSRQAIERVEQALADGYRRIKLKASPAAEMDVLRSALDACNGSERAIDANGSFSIEHMEMLLGLTRDGIDMMEQPFPPDRLDWHGGLRGGLGGTRLCLDESIESIGDLQSAAIIVGPHELNLKPGRVGGQLEACWLLQSCLSSGMGCWIGGMFETGIGRLANLRHAACLPDATAHDLSPSSRYFERDIVMQPLEMDDDGTIAIGNADPVELDEQAIDEMTEHKEVLEPGR